VTTLQCLLEAGITNNANIYMSILMGFPIIESNKTINKVRWLVTKITGSMVFKQ
jgi:TATA-binding protein-associated factor Taf7